MAWLTPSDRAAPSRRDAPGVFFLRAMLMFLLAYTTWAWAGLRPSFHWVAVAVAGLLLAGFFAQGRGEAWRVARRDPVLYLGLAFLLFLAAQWANAGRARYFDVGHQRWMYMPPRWPGWPSAFAKADALQMLTWFFPAWAIAVVIRSRKLDRRALRRLMTFVACNAGLLAIFGLLQLAHGGGAIYWVQPLKSHFFASFAYGNHAGPFFVLAGAVAAGLLYREVFDVRCSSPERPSVSRLCHPWRVAVLIPMLVLCLVGANLGFSRAGVILAGALTVFVVAYGGFRSWRKLSAASRLNFAALSLAALGGLYFTVVALGETGIRREFMPPDAGEGADEAETARLHLDLGARPRFLRAAVDIWRGHPWFGTGGWGFRYLVAEHVPEELWPALESRGWANVHCDLLQFLVEFGLVGFGLLAGAAGVRVREALGRQCRRDAIWMMGMAGLGLVVVFSLVDLPFRCPAILFTWVALLAALPRICQNPGSGTPATPVAALSPGKRNGWNPRPSAEGGPGPGRIHA